LQVIFQNPFTFFAKKAIIKKSASPIPSLEARLFWTRLLYTVLNSDISLVIEKRMHNAYAFLSGEVMITVKDLTDSYKKLKDKEVSLSGFIKLSRHSGSICFISLSDGTSFKPVQIVIEEGKIDKSTSTGADKQASKKTNKGADTGADKTSQSNLSFADIAKLGGGSAIRVSGKLILTPKNKQPFEIIAHSVQLIGASPEHYPLQKKRHSVEFLREIAHLRPRTNLFSAVFKVRSVASFALHKYFNERNYVYVNTPIITTSDCEGAGELFTVTTLPVASEQRTANSEQGAEAPNSTTKKSHPSSLIPHPSFEKDFFKEHAYLTVSGQLQVEAYAYAFSKVYTFGPTFRAENSNTPRHAAEFWMLEPEVAFCELPQIMDIAEDMLKYTIAYVLENAKDELEFLDEFVEKGLLDRLNKILKQNFVRLPYTEAVALLQDTAKNKKAKFENKIEWGDDLATEHEKFLTAHFEKPVFVTDWPASIKPFYMKVSANPSGSPNSVVRNFDLLVNLAGELIGGSQREDCYETLKQRMEQAGVCTISSKWYLDLREYGSVPTSGFGIGFERLIMYLTGVQNIRDVLPFPRTPGNAKY